MRLATSALGITAKETHIVTDTAVALALAGTGLGLTLASPIMMSLGGDDVELHPVAEAGGREIIVLTSPEPSEPVRAVAEVVAGSTAGGLTGKPTAGPSQRGLGDGHRIRSRGLRPQGLGARGHDGTDVRPSQLRGVRCRLARLR